MRSCAACWSTMIEAVARLRHDIGLVHLRARRAERALDQIRPPARNFPRAHRPTARRPSKAACAASAKPSAATPPRIARKAGDSAASAAPASAANLAAAARRAHGPERRDGGAAAGGGARAGPRAPAHPFSARTISPRTSPPSRKRTSVLAGCTLTSTSRASSVTNNASSG